MNILAYALLVSTLNGLVKRAVKAGLTAEELQNGWEAVMASLQSKEAKK